MKKLLIMLVSCTLLNGGFADNKDQFMLGDYRIMDVMQSDLNSDGLDDLVLLVKDTKLDGYQKILDHKTIFSSENENGGVYFPPNLMVSLKKDILTIYYAHGRYGAWDIKDFKEAWEKLPTVKIIKLSEIEDIDEFNIL